LANRLFRLAAFFELDERKAAWFAGLSIRRKIDTSWLSGCGEMCSQVRFGGIVWQIPNKDTNRHNYPLITDGIPTAFFRRRGPSLSAHWPVEWRLVAATASAKASTAATGPLGSGSRLVDRQRPAIQLGAVELGDDLLSILVVHLDEPEALGATGIPIGNDVCRFDIADLLEEVRDVSLRRIKRQISNVDSFTHSFS
jgi:hypothetical protein